jgi:CRISPR-associated exonuclease Cas4
MEAFSDIATAAYCPRQLYYRRKHADHDVPDEAAARRDLAFRYDELLDPATDLRDEPVEATPTQFRARLSAATERLDAWPALADPAGREVLLAGKDARGIAHKVLDGDGPAPEAPTVSVVSAGEPPERGVWEPDSVLAVAAAKALAWERETAVEHAFVEYPAHGVVRRISLGTRRKAAYRHALRAARSMDGPPPRLENDDRCAPCDYRAECGTRTRTLRSLLGGD